MLVKSQANKEKWAAENIRAQGRECYYPRYEDANGFLRPLFPTYLFVNSPDWWFLKGTFGVSHVVQFEGNAAIVPPSVVKDLMRAERVGMKLKAAPLEPGMRVRVSGGQFADMIGVYEGQSGRDRARVLFMLLGREVCIVEKKTRLVPVDEVEKPDG